MTEQAIRLSVFLSMLLGLCIWEIVAPRRAHSMNRQTRWPVNLFLTVFNTGFVKLVVPITAVGAALTAQHHGWGLFSVFALPSWLTLILSIVVMDLILYGQHVLTHRLPILWRLHRVHHLDGELDVTSGARFHPLEITLSLCIKCGAAILLGIPPEGMLIHEIFLNAAAMFNHSNIYLPPRLDFLLRWVLVTPDMHRIHHSVDASEHHRNFGFALPWWDYLFKTYTKAPKVPQKELVVGLGPEPKDTPTLWQLLKLEKIIHKQ